MKSRLTFIFLFIFVSCVAPTPSPTLYVEKGTTIYYKEKLESSFDSLIKAITWFESKNDTAAYNPHEEAVGAFQIRQCKLDDYNTATHSNYTLKDCYSYETSKRIFLHFARGKDYEHAAKDWNGSGIKVTTYWDNIKKYL
jgi:hypothetical protein